MSLNRCMNRTGSRTTRVPTGRSERWSSTSWWEHHVADPWLRRAPLTGDTTADACVVGGGIAGLSVALSLLERGMSVILLEAAAIGAGETRRSSGHLVSALDDRCFQLEHVHGAESAALAVASHAAAIDEIEARVARHGIECGFARVAGNLHVPDTIGDGDDLLGRELAAARRCGLAVERVESQREGGPALRFHRQAPWESLYAPHRFRNRAVGAFLRENGNTLLQYADLAQRGAATGDTRLAHGEGRVVRRGLALRAVSRDRRGAVKERSAICPHLGGVVRWNEVEQSWDCPCHGSRFALDGRVIDGPANRDLGDEPSP